MSDDGDEGRPEPPSFRATIRRGRIMLTSWAPWVARNGPYTNLLRERAKAGVTIADLTHVGDDDEELAVRFYAEGSDREEAEGALLEWARAVGYRRVWLPDRIEEIEPEPGDFGTAAVRCPSCGIKWEDSSPEFWLAIRRDRVFPRWCLICGWELPQWTVDRPRARPRRHVDRGSPESWHAARRRDRTRQREG